MTIFFNKKKKAEEAGSPVEYYRRGEIKCGACSKLFSLESCVSLSMTECPSCGESIFVPLKIADFWLCAPLGGGGMGAVYAAYREGGGKEEYAVKVLPRKKKGDRELIETLSQEAEVCRAISGHPGLVNYVDSGLYDTEYYLAMEFVHGMRLDRRIAKGGKFREAEVLLAALQILSAEAHIYNRGYLYRDLKPQNVIVSKERGTVLYDYGLCKPLIDALTPVEGGHFRGSVFYCPPERATGEAEYMCSEIYSLGMVMYHALTGKPFFDSENSNTLVKRHVSSLRLGQSLREGKHGGKMKLLQSDMADVLSRMIEREPQRRYQRVVDLEHDLIKILSNRLQVA